MKMQEARASIVQGDRLEMARALLSKAGSELVPPVNAMVTDVFDFEAPKVGALRTVALAGIGPQDIGVDVGETTLAMFARVVTRARTVVWNGPRGVVDSGNGHGHARDRAGAGGRHGQGRHQGVDLPFAKTSTS